MRRSTLLISQHLIDEHEILQNLTVKDLQDLLSTLMSDPDLWRKIRLLKSDKYTKTYQAKNLNLVPLKFFPVPEDWCQLSILSNGTGFSRCYIFVFLLKFYLGIYRLEDFTNQGNFCPTNQANCNVNTDKRIYCKVDVDKSSLKLTRKIKTAKTNGTCSSKSEQVVLL